MTDTPDPKCPPVNVVTGRTPMPLAKKLNPIWWFGNHDEPDPPAWYMPGKPQALRVAAWYVRNPLVNFADYVAGVCDKNYTVHGTGAHSPVAADDNTTGWRWSLIKGAAPVPLPFVSYTGNNVVWYAGWKWTGDLGFKFNIRNSPVQAV